MGSCAPSLRRPRAPQPKQPKHQSQARTSAIARENRKQRHSLCLITYPCLRAALLLICLFDNLPNYDLVSFWSFAISVGTSSVGLNIPRLLTFICPPALPTSLAVQTDRQTDRLHDHSTTTNTTTADSGIDALVTKHGDRPKCVLHHGRRCAPWPTTSITELSLLTQLSPVRVRPFTIREAAQL